MGKPVRVQPQNEEAPPLPSNPEAEASVLGAVLLSNDALIVAAETLHASDFYGPQNATIFAEMLAMRDAGIPIDSLTLVEALHRKGKLEAAGGAPFINQAVDGVPKVVNVAHYAQIVAEKARLRRVIHEAHAIQQSALDAHEESSTIVGRARLAFATLADLEAAAADQQFHTVEDFMTSPGVSFAIEGFLPTQGATFIAGLSGHAKTLVMLSMVRSSLTGEKLFGHFPVTQKAERVIYLIPESTIGPFKHRLGLFGLMQFVADGRLLTRTLSKGPTIPLSDPRMLAAVVSADVYADTIIRFGAEGSSENDASDVARGLSEDVFRILGAGARLFVGAQHSPKSFATATLMTLENVLRGSGDYGAILGACWGLRQLDPGQNIVYVQNVKARDFEASGPFQIVGRPYIDEEGDFRMHRLPRECGGLAEYLDQPGRNRGGAPDVVQEAKRANLALLRGWLQENPNESSEDLSRRFKACGIEVSPITIRRYKQELRK